MAVNKEYFRKVEDIMGTISLELALDMEQCIKDGRKRSTRRYGLDKI